MINCVVVHGGGEHELKKSSGTPNNFHQLNRFKQVVSRNQISWFHAAIKLTKDRFSKWKDRI